MNLDELAAKATQIANETGCSVTLSLRAGSCEMKASARPDPSAIMTEAETRAYVEPPLVRDPE